jgi:hypothetical protein
MTAFIEGLVQIADIIIEQMMKKDCSDTTG